MDLIGEIRACLQKSIENCLEIGIKSDRIIIDPGIGFGKTVEQSVKNLGILSQKGMQLTDSTILDIMQNMQ